MIIPLIIRKTVFSESELLNYLYSLLGELFGQETKGVTQDENFVKNITYSHLLICFFGKNICDSFFFSKAY